LKDGENILRRRHKIHQRRKYQLVECSIDKMSETGYERLGRPTSHLRCYRTQYMHTVQSSSAVLSLGVAFLSKVSYPNQAERMVSGVEPAHF